MSGIVFKNKIPLFKRGHILDKEILDNLRIAPYEFYSLAYNNHVQGIITGIELYAEDNFIVINPGIIKFYDFYYRIGEKLKLEIPMEDGDYIIKIKFYKSQVVELEKYLEYKSEIYLDENEKLEENEIELGKIKRREGAEIRNTDSFIKLDKEYNIISEIAKPQSSENGVLLSKQLLQLFIKKINEDKEMDMIDDIFSLSVLSSQITREALNFYIYKKLDVDSSKATNEELYKYLEKIYLIMKESRKVKKSRIVTKNKMIVE